MLLFFFIPIVSWKEWLSFRFSLWSFVKNILFSPPSNLKGPFSLVSELLMRPLAWRPLTCTCVISVSMTPVIYTSTWMHLKNQIIRASKLSFFASLMIKRQPLRQSLPHCYFCAIVKCHVITKKVYRLPCVAVWRASVRQLRHRLHHLHHAWSGSQVSVWRNLRAFFSGRRVINLVNLSPSQHHLLPGCGSDSALLCAGEEGGAPGQVLGGRWGMNKLYLDTLLTLLTRVYCRLRLVLVFYSCLNDNFFNNQLKYFAKMVQIVLDVLF